MRNDFVFSESFSHDKQGINWCFRDERKNKWSRRQKNFPAKERSSRARHLAHHAISLDGDNLPRS